MDGNVKIDVSLQTQNFIKGINDMQDTAKTGMQKLNTAIETSVSALARLEKKQEELTKKHAEASAELVRQADALKGAGDDVSELTVKYEKQKQVVTTLESEIKEINKSIEKQQTRVADLTSEWAKSITKMADFAKSAKELGEKLKEAGDNMEKAGKKLSLGVTAPLVAAATLAVKSTVDFESAFAGIRKTVDATEAEYAQMEKEIKSMAKTIPASAKEIAGIGEMAGQLGIKKENIVAFSRTIIDLGNSTNLAGEAAASTLAQLFMLR